MLESNQRGDVPPMPATTEKIDQSKHLELVATSPTAKVARPLVPAGSFLRRNFSKFGAIQSRKRGNHGQIWLMRKSVKE